MQSGLQSPRVRLAWVDLGWFAGVLLAVVEFGFDRPGLPEPWRIALALAILAGQAASGGTRSTAHLAVLLGVAAGVAAQVGGIATDINLLACLYAGILVYSAGRLSAWLHRGLDWASGHPVSAVLLAWPMLAGAAFVVLTLPGCTTDRVTYAPHYLPQTLLHSAFMAVSIVTLTGLEVEPLGEWFSPNGLIAVWLIMLASGALGLWAIRQMVRAAGGEWSSRPLGVIVGAWLAIQVLSDGGMTGAWLFDQTALMLHAGLSLSASTIGSIVPLLLGAMVLPLCARLPRCGSRYLLPWAVVLAAGVGALRGVSIHQDVGIWTPGPVSVSAPGSTWAAVQQAVSARSHGAVVDGSVLPPAGWLVLACLMFAGGMPGGFAAGLGTTTLAVLGATAWAALRGREQVWLFGVVPARWIHRAVLWTAVFVALHVLSLTLVLTLERGVAADNPALVWSASHNASSLRAAWVTFNACCGTGLQADGVRSLTPGSMWVLMAAMLLARVLPVALVLHWLEADRRAGAAERSQVLL